MLGKFGMVDVDWVKGGMLTTRLSGSVKITDVAQCKRDLLDAIFEAGKFCTVRGEPLQGANGQSAEHAVVCFEVLDKKIVDKKTLGEGGFGSASYPVLLQKNTVWPPASFETFIARSEIEVCPEGDAEVVDAFTLSTWWSMFEALRSWACAGRSDV